MDDVIPFVGAGVDDIISFVGAGVDDINLLPSAPSLEAVLSGLQAPLVSQLKFASQHSPKAS